MYIIPASALRVILKRVYTSASYGRRASRIAPFRYTLYARAGEIRELARSFTVAREREKRSEGGAADLRASVKAVITERQSAFVFERLRIYTRLLVLRRGNNNLVYFFSGGGGGGGGGIFVRV